MKLNDPFGRMAVKRQKEYEVVRESLQNTKINDRATGEALLADIRQRGKKMILVIVPIALALALLFPDVWIAFIAVAVIFVAWVITTTRNGLQCVQRYIDEELSGPVSPEVTEND